jgi:hypothetical protein
LICGQHKTSVLVAELKSFSLPEIKPSIEAAQQNREEKNKSISQVEAVFN